MANPSTIMGAAALSYFDVAEGGLFQDAAATTAAADGDPVAYLPDQVAGAFTTDTAGYRPIYRANAGDPYLEGDLSFLRKSLSRSGAFYIAMDFVFPVANSFHLISVLSTNPTQFYSGSDWFNLRGGFFTDNARAENPNHSDITTDRIIAAGTRYRLEYYQDGTNAGIAINGGAFTTTAAATIPDTEFFDLFAGRDGGLDGGAGTVNLRRGVLLNAIPDSTQRAALLDWAENGDVGGAGEITGALTAQETGSDAASASVEVVVSGTVAAQESGADGAAASVAVGIAAALVGQETGSDLATATGAVSLEAALVAQEVGADSAAASASVAVGITISAQETGQDLASGSATVAVAGAVAAQEAGSDGAAVSGAVAVAGALAAQEAGQDGALGSATVAVAGAVAAQEAGSDGAAVSGAVAVAGALAAQESGADRAVIQAGSGRVVTLAAQEAGSDLAGASAAVAVEAALGAQEAGGDTAAVVVSVEDNVITVNLAAREAGADQAAVAVGVAVVAEVAGSETGADVASIRAFLFAGRQAFAGQSGSFTRGASGRRASQGAEGVRITRAG